MEEPSQFSVGQTAQRSLTCSITEKPHTGLDDCLNMLLACFRATMSAAYGRSFLWPSPYLPVMAADRDRLLGNFSLGLVKLWKELLRKTLLDLERRLTAYYSQNCSGLLEFPSRKLISQRSFPSLHLSLSLSICFNPCILCKLDFCCLFDGFYFHSSSKSLLSSSLSR